VALTKEAIHKLRLIKKAIIANYKLYNQNSYCSDSECGTTLCIAGWYTKLFASRSTYYRRRKKSQATFEMVEDPFYKAAMQGLGLTDDQAWGLFRSNYCWPSQYRAGYQTKSAAKKAGQYIENFIRMHGGSN
jgi:hypothetical protein